MGRIARLLLLVVSLGPAAVTAAQDAVPGPARSTTESTTDGRSGAPGGRSLLAALEDYRQQGLPLVYTTQLVTESLQVTHEPRAITPREAVSELLAPHGLRLRALEDLLLVVRDEGTFTVAEGAQLLVMVRQGETNAPVRDPIFSSTAELPAMAVRGRGLYEFSPLQVGRYAFRVSAPGFHSEERMVDIEGPATEVVVVRMAPAPYSLTRMVVSSSRYELDRGGASAPTFLDRRTIESTPDLGSDPLRAIQRLPGTASGGLSGQTHVRGGDLDEVGIHLNGHRLLDPFHIRDYQSIFSVVDVRAIDAMEVYTGGFPVRYGDRTSGLVLIEATAPEATSRTELGLSTYNASFLTSGTRGDVDWLVSARSATLDEFISSRLGTPSYFDVFGQVGYAPTPDTRLVAHALVAEDAVDIVFDNAGEEQDRSRSDTRNRQFWLTWEQHWSPALSSSTVLSHASLDNDRLARVSEPEQIDGRVDDRRHIDITGLRQDWRLDGDGRTLLAGFEYRDERARYDYAGAVAYDGAFAIIDGVPLQRETLVAARPSGASYGAYLAAEWTLTERLALEGGLRYDRQTYTGTSTGAGPDSQWSPRIAVRLAAEDDTLWRLSLGRYHQAQGIEHLQVEDGESTFYRAEAVDHWIASWQRPFGDGYAARVEAYYKDLRRLRPRFENLLDPLTLIPELQPDRVRIDPEGGRARGIELSLSRRSDDWQAWATYVIAEVDERVDGRTQPRSWDQRHALQAGIAWERGPWTLSAAASIRSGWPRTDLTLVESGEEAEDFTLAFGPRNAGRFGTFASLDLRLSRTFRFEQGTLTGFLEVTNALDRQNPCCLDFDVDDGELELDEEYWLPVVPALGLRWDF